MMVRAGSGIAAVSFDRGQGETVTRNGRYEVMRLIDPTDAAAAIAGAICIGHEFGHDGISVSPAEARRLAATLVSAADECDALIAQKRTVAS